MCVRSTPVTTCSSSWLSPVAEHPTGLFSIWLWDIWLGSVLALRHGVAMNIFSIGSYIFPINVMQGVLLVIVLEVVIWNASVQWYLKLSNGLPKQFYYRHSHQQGLQDPVASNPHQPLMLWSFSSGQFWWVCHDRCRGSGLHSSNEPRCWASFHMLTDHMGSACSTLLAIFLIGIRPFSH